MTTSTPTVRIAVFGALEITHAGGVPQRPPTQRVLALLGYLITHHHTPQGRDKLVEVLWPDLLPRQGRRILSDTLWRARRLLTPPDHEDTTLLQIAGDAVTFRPTPDTWVDLLAFEHALQPSLASAAPQLVRQAVELYRGDFLEDCYDDWALFERERLRELYLSALQRLLAHDQASKNYDGGLQVALRLVQADPLREDAHRALMRLYYLLGREADALRAFAQCREVLERELGVEPDQETLSLYDEILALQRHRGSTLQRTVGTPTAPAPPIVRDLPFVGRQAQRAELMEAVEAALGGLGGVLLLAGAAGLGKSRLLHEIASGAEWRGAQVSWGRAREDAMALPFGALREALGSILTPERTHQLAQLLPAHLLGALLPLLPQISEFLPDSMLHPPPGEGQAALLHAAIGSALVGLGQLAPLVLILEDLHWFDPASLAALGAIAPALHNAPVLLLLSGRADELPRRGAVWETVLRLDRAGLLRRVELEGLNEAECAELVRRALHLRQPAPRFSTRLWAATGGNPFFVLETLRSLQEQGVLTRDAQGVWHTPWDHPATDYDALPLPAHLHTAIGGRLRELGSTEREALAAAAVLGQNFTPATLARMVAAPALPPELLRRQFVVEDASGYRFGHATLREVIYEELDAPTRQTLHLRAAEALEQDYYAQVEALAQHFYLAGAWEKALPYLLQAGDRARAVYAWQDALRFYDQAAQAAETTPAATDLPTFWNIQLKRGEVATLLGDYPVALVAYETILQRDMADLPAADATVHTTARHKAEIQALNGLCYVYGMRTDYPRARAVIQRAMALAADSPRLLDRAEVFYQAGLISFRMDDYAEARRFFDEALQMYEALGLDTERAKCLLTLGWSYLRQDGPTDQVIDYYTQALDIHRRQGDRFAEHSCLADIASTHLLRGRLVETIETVEQCLQFFSSIHALEGVSLCLYTRGEAYRRMGRSEEAIEALRESSAICARMDRHAAAEFNRVCIAAALRDLGRYGEALQMVERLLESDDRMTKTRTLLIVTDIWRNQGQIERARQHLEEGFRLSRWLGSRVCTGIAYRLLAQLRIADTRGQLPAADAALPDAETSFSTSRRLLQEAHCDDELALTCIAYGQYLLKQRRTQEAHVTLLQAETLLQRCGMTTHLEKVRQALQHLAVREPSPSPGQVLVRLARQGIPRGRPLRPDEFAEVVWTLESAEDEQARAQGGKVAERHTRIRRLCAEALAQGAEPTVGDLANALGVNARTVDRDIAALRAAGETIITRGAAA